MVLHPALADMLPPSNARVMVEPAGMVCDPVTSVATKVFPSRSLRVVRLESDADALADAEADADPEGDPEVVAPPPAVPLDPHAARPTTSTLAPSRPSNPRNRTPVTVKPPFPSPDIRPASSQNGS